MPQVITWLISEKDLQTGLNKTEAKYLTDRREGTQIPWLNEKTLNKQIKPNLNKQRKPSKRSQDKEKLKQSQEHDRQLHFEYRY